MATITIAAITIPDWHGSTSSVVLRVYNDKPFTTPGGVYHAATAKSNPASLGTFYKDVTCTFASGSLTIPSFTLDSTIDSTDNPDATYSAVFFDLLAQQVVQNFGNPFALDPATTATTWKDIFTIEAE